MRKILVTLFLLTAIAGNAQVIEFINASGSSFAVGYGHPLPTVASGETNAGVLAISTGSLTVGTSASVLVGTTPRARGDLLIGVTGGDLNFGGSGVTGTANWPFFIASGTYIKWSALASTTARIYLRGRTGTVTAFLEFIGE